MLLRPLLGIALTVVSAVLLGASPANAATIDLTASMDCAQADAGNGTCQLGGSGTGTAIILFDTDTNVLSWNISWSGLSAPATFLHFHGPALPHQNAGVMVDIGVGANPAIGAAALTDQQEADLLNELWYVNLHTLSFPGGEIRGQVTVVPEPSAGLLLALGLGGLALQRRRVD